MRAVVDGMQLAGALDARFPALLAAESKSKVVGPGYNHAITKHVWYLEWAGDTTGGEAVIETAGHPDFAGLWAPLHTIPFGVAGEVVMRSYDGKLQASRVRMTQATDGAGVVVRFSGHRG